MKTTINNMLNHLEQHPIIGFACAVATPIATSIVTTLTSDQTVKLVSTFSLYMGAAVAFLTVILQFIKVYKAVAPSFKRIAVQLFKSLKKP